MSKQPKAKPEIYGQKKTERFQVLFTLEGLRLLDELAAQCQVSRSEFLERSVRWFREHWDDQLKNNEEEVK